MQRAYLVKVQLARAVGIVHLEEPRPRLPLLAAAVGGRLQPVFEGHEPVPVDASVAFPG